MPPKKKAKTDEQVHSTHHGLGTCHMPEVPTRDLDPDVQGVRLRLIRYTEKKWLNGSTLKYYFFDEGDQKGLPSNVDLVRQAFQAWADVGIGLKFEETTDINEATIRIGFLQGDGAWSYVGTDVRKYPGALEPTMNFGWDLTQDPRGGGLDTPIHEIGHTLGFPHEHQNPFSGIVWDEEAVYKDLGSPPNNWPRETTYHNIIRKISPQEVAGSKWDPNSIMHYGFGPGLILEPVRYNGGLSPTDGLTATDKLEAKKFYPPIDEEEEVEELKYLESVVVDIGEGEQKNFTIAPHRTDDYVIETLGKTDTLIELDEDVDGNLEMVAEDDDSGRGRNAKIKVHLLRGKKYLLRVRLYYNRKGGKLAVIWR